MKSDNSAVSDSVTKGVDNSFPPDAVGSRPSLFFFKLFLRTKYFLILGFTIALVFFTVFFFPNFLDYSKKKELSWGFFSSSLGFFFLYLFFFAFYWKKLDMHKMYKPLVAVFATIGLVIFLQIFCILNVERVLIFSPKIISLGFFILATPLSFIGITLSMKIFQDWQRSFLQPRSKSS